MATEYIENQAADEWEFVRFDDAHGPYYLYEHKACGCIMAKKRNYCPDCGKKMEVKHESTQKARRG